MSTESGETVAGTPATKSVKRILLGVLVVACLTVVAIASGATTRGYHGTVGSGGTIHFRAEVANGQILEVRGFGWRRVQITCRQGKFPFRGGFGGDTFAVEAGGFDAHGDAGTTYKSHAKLVGHFRKHGQRAAGTLRIRGDLDAHHTNCDSGLKRWWAKRGS
jgi:hypothetical protein